MSVRVSRRPLPGFPIEEPFTSRAGVDEYLSGERITCLRCGRKLKRLGGHLKTVHGWTTEEYKMFYQLPLSSGRGLCSAPTRAAYSAALKGRSDYEEFVGAPPSAGARRSRSTFKAGVAFAHLRVPPVDVECPICGSIFTRKRADVATCSKRCASRLLSRSAIPKNCNQCGRAHVARVGHQLFCSTECKDLARRGPRRRLKDGERRTRDRLILLARRSGLTQMAIANRFGVSVTTVRKALGAQPTDPPEPDAA